MGHGCQSLLLIHQIVYNGNTNSPYTPLLVPFLLLAMHSPPDFGCAPLQSHRGELPGLCQLQVGNTMSFGGKAITVTYLLCWLDTGL